MKRWLAYLGLLAIGTLFTTGLSELALRLGGLSYPIFYAPDELTGHRLRPNAQGWWRDEGEAFIRVNGEGLRDREHDKLKSADTVRIAVLGDSFAEALQVPMEQTFWSVLEAE